jgi:hypothetical protein
VVAGVKPRILLSLIHATAIGSADTTGKADTAEDVGAMKDVLADTDSNSGLGVVGIVWYRGSIPNRTSFWYRIARRY